MKYNPDSLVQILLTRFADMMILNILFLVTSLPVITIGAAWTSLYYVALKILQDDKGEAISVIKSYFHSFRQNFLIATGIWILALLLGGVLFLDIRIINSMEMSGLQVILRIAVGAVVLLFLAALQFSFPMLSRFRMSFLSAIKNAVLMAIGHFPRAFLMLGLTAGLAWITLLNKYTIYTGIFVWMTFGFSAVALIKAKQFLPLFAGIGGGNTGKKPGEETEEEEKIGG